MTKRHTPPGRMSKLDVVVVKPFGPHHCARCFGSVHIEKTSSRGASNSRTPMIERESTSRSMLFVAAIVLLLASFGLQRFQIIVEAIETFVEKAPVVVEPIVDVFERPRLDAARPPLRATAARDQSGALQNLQVLGNRRQAHGERLCQFGHGSFAQSQA